MGQSLNKLKVIVKDKLSLVEEINGLWIYGIFFDKINNEMDFSSIFGSHKVSGTNLSIKDNIHVF